MISTYINNCCYYHYTAILYTFKWEVENDDLASVYLHNYIYNRHTTYIQYSYNHIHIETSYIQTIIQ